MPTRRRCHFCLGCAENCTLTAVCAIMVHFVVHEAAPITNKAASVGLKKVYTDPRFWRLAPLSASCIGTAWALQGLWAAQWLADVDGLDREGVVQYLFIMAVALSIGAIGLGIAACEQGRRVRYVTCAGLVNELAGHDITLRAGQYITTGSCTVPLTIEAGDTVTATFAGLGGVTARFSAEES